LIVLLALLVAMPARAQEEPMCVENSPERRGEIGCSIVETKRLPNPVKEPIFWHIDQFESPQNAKAGIGPSSIAFEAHGTWWLMYGRPKSINVRQRE
jgi:hypothetical protein